MLALVLAKKPSTLSSRSMSLLSGGTRPEEAAELRRAELVQSRRSAKQVYYRLANDDVSVCVRSIEAILGSGRDAFAAVSAVVAENPKRWPKELGSAGAAAFAKII